MFGFSPFLWILIDILGIVLISLLYIVIKDKIIIHLFASSTFSSDTFQNAVFIPNYDHLFVITLLALFIPKTVETHLCLGSLGVHTEAHI